MVGSKEYSILIRKEKFTPYIKREKAQNFKFCAFSKTKVFLTTIP